MDSNVSNDTTMINPYVEKAPQYTEVTDVINQSSHEPVPSTSNCYPASGHVTVSRRPTLNSSDESLNGYNTLTLKSASSNMVAEYATSTKKSTKGKSGKAKGKGKLAPIKNLGGRLSQFFNEKMYAQQISNLTGQTSSGIENVYTNEVNQGVSLDPDPDQNPYFVLEETERKKQQEYENSNEFPENVHGKPCDRGEDAGYSNDNVNSCIQTEDSVISLTRGGYSSFKLKAHAKRNPPAEYSMVEQIENRDETGSRWRPIWQNKLATDSGTNRNERMCLIITARSYQEARFDISWDSIYFVTINLIKFGKWTVWKWAIYNYTCMLNNTKTDHYTVTLNMY